MFGAIVTGVFATVGATGLIAGNMKQLMIQVIAVVAAAAYAIIVTFIITFILDKTIGLRVDKEDEIMGAIQEYVSFSDDAVVIVIDKREMKGFYK